MAELTLPIELLVNVDVAYSPQLLSNQDFAQACIIGSTVTSREEPVGVYTSMQAVAEHYSEEDKEYLIAQKLFAQVPRPKSVLIATVEGIVFPESDASA